MLKIGQQVTDFELNGFYKDEIKKYRLSDYRGKWIVLFAYPADFTFVCPTEVEGFHKHHSEFTKLNAEIIGLSTDSAHSHKAWVEREWKELAYPLVSDTEKTVIYRYGIDTQDEELGVVALRATFIIDPDGILKHMTISDNNVGRSVEETLRVLQALQSGKLCPVEWEPGQATLN